MEEEEEKSKKSSEIGVQSGGGREKEVGLVESGLGLFQFLLLLSSPFSPSCGKVYGVLSFFNKTRKRWPVHALARAHIHFILFMAGSYFVC